MKNIHILPTDKPSRLLWSFEDRRYYSVKEEILFKNQNELQNQNIYITSDEEIKEGDWVLANYDVFKILKEDADLANKELKLFGIKIYSKIILTTDQDLIEDGVQPINDEFLKWFIKNPSCEEVEVDILKRGIYDEYKYKIIIPKEFEMYEDLYGKYVKLNDRFETEHIWNKELALKNKGKWIPKEESKCFDCKETISKERSYSEEEVLELLNSFNKHTLQLQKLKLGNSFYVKDWFEQFKKK